MRKLTAIAVVAMSLASSIAMAATPTTTTGAIKTMDPKACTITLDSGDASYSFGKKCNFSKLTVGEKVAITWSLQGGKDVASKIVAAKA